MKGAEHAEQIPQRAVKLYVKQEVHSASGHQKTTISNNQERVKLLKGYKFVSVPLKVTRLPVRKEG